MHRHFTKNDCQPPIVELVQIVVWQSNNISDGEKHYSHNNPNKFQDCEQWYHTVADTSNINIQATEEAIVIGTKKYLRQQL